MSFVLTVLSVMLSVQPRAIGAETTKGAEKQRQTILPRTPISPELSRGFVPAPPPVSRSPGYLSRTPLPALRFDAAHQVSPYSGPNKSAVGVDRGSSRRDAVGRGGQFEEELFSASNPRGKTKAGDAPVKPDVGSRSTDVDLQKLVHYFEPGKSASTNASGSLSFVPPVKEGDLSKTPTSTSGAKN